VSLLELLFVGVLALLILGPEKFFGLMHQLGRALSELKDAAATFRSQLEQEARQLDRAGRVNKNVPTEVDVDDLVECDSIAEAAAPSPRRSEGAWQDKSLYESNLGSPDQPASSPNDLPKASLWAHLEELRRRFLYSLMGLGVGFGVCWYFAGGIFDFMQKPIVETLHRYHFDQQLVYLNPTEPFNLYLRIALSAGVLLACPFVLYQLWLFVSPGLYHHEKRLVVPFVLSMVALFLSGALFGYRIVYPAALNFLIGYGVQFKPAVTIGEYTDLFLSTILGLGLVFEFPVLMGFLGWVGFVSAGWLWRNLRYSILVIFIIAGIITPTADLLNMCIFAAPMVCLYLLSIAVVWAADRKRKRMAGLRRSTG
jgi:sec-independent protein translocase protein TatC